MNNYQIQKKKAYKIAEQQLKSSFIVESTIGFKEFLEKNKKIKNYVNDYDHS